MPRTILFSLTLILSHALTTPAGDWNQWRGPNQDGTVSGEDWPVTWSDTENIVWKTPIPGWGTSTPIIHGEHIVVAGEVGGNNALIGLNRDGDKLWETVFGPAADNANRKAGAQNPSPTTDGNLVFGYFKSGDLACVDFEGNIVWQTNLQDEYGRVRMNWDLGTSPVLTQDLVVIAVMHQGPSYLVGLNKETGDIVWKQDRVTDAPGESQDSYSTPLVLEDDGRETIVILGSDTVTAHLATTGEELWRVEGLNPGGERNWRSIAGPVAADGMLFAPYARGNTLTAIRLGGQGDVTDSHVAWTIRGSFPDVPVPAAHGGRVYICSDRGDITCVDAASGDELWTERLPRGGAVYSSSPIIAGGNLYATNEEGLTHVLALGDEPELVASNALYENTYSTPAFVDGRIYLRTSEFLFCIGHE